MVMLSIKRCLPKEVLTLFKSWNLLLSSIKLPRQCCDGKNAKPTLTGSFNWAILGLWNPFDLTSEFRKLARLLEIECWPDFWLTNPEHPERNTKTNNNTNSIEKNCRFRLNKLVASLLLSVLCWLVIITNVPFKNHVNAWLALTLERILVSASFWLLK